MRDVNDIPDTVREKFEVFNWRNAIAVLGNVHTQDFLEVLDVLSRFRLNHTDFSVAGGNKSRMASFIDRELGVFGWQERSFDTKIVVDTVETPSPTHKVTVSKARSLWRLNGTTRTRSSIVISTIFVCCSTCKLLTPESL